MEAVPQETAERVDLDRLAAEIRAVMAPHFAVPGAEQIQERTTSISSALCALLDETRGREDREAVRVMRRLATSLLGSPASLDASPFTAWQYLLHLARTTQALVDAAGRQR